VLLEAAIKHATKMGVPQCIAIVDEGCNLVGFFRMTGSRVLSIQSGQRKAMTAASTGKPTGSLTPRLISSWRSPPTAKWSNKWRPADLLQ
jgi:uncharacterized protein GlcG (DUF336 family)